MNGDLTHNIGAEYSVIVSPVFNDDSFALHHSRTAVCCKPYWYVEWGNLHRYCFDSKRKMLKQLKKNAELLLSGQILIGIPFMRSVDTDIRAMEIMMIMETHREEIVYAYHLNTYTDDGEPVQRIGEVKSRSETEAIHKLIENGVCNRRVYEYLQLTPCLPPQTVFSSQEE